MAASEAAKRSTSATQPVRTQPAIVAGQGQWTRVRGDERGGPPPERRNTSPAVADSHPGPLDEPTLDVLQSLPHLPAPMSDLIKFRVGDRTIWLVPAVDVETWSQQWAEIRLRESACEWPGRDALLRLSDASCASSRNG